MRKDLSFEKDDAGKFALSEAREHDQIVKLVVVHSSTTKAVFAHAVPVMGSDE